MGIWRDVYFEKSGPVAIRGARVLSKLDLTSLSHADLTLKAELSNTTDQAIRATVEGTICTSTLGISAMRSTG